MDCYTVVIRITAVLHQCGIWLGTLSGGLLVAWSAGNGDDHATSLRH